MRFNPLPQISAILATFALIATSNPVCHAQGTNLYWFPQNGSNTWNDGNNWNTLATGLGTPLPWQNTGGYNANFAGTTVAVNLIKDEEVNIIAFNAAGFSLTGSSFTLSNNNSLTPNSTSGVNTNAFNATINSQILGTMGMNKNGTGTLTLTSANLYTGVTNINAGSIAITNATALGAGGAGNNAVVSVGASLQISGGLNVATLLTLNGSGTSNAGALENTLGNNTYSGAITLGSASRINSDAGTLTITGGITGAQNLTIGGAGNTSISSIIGTGAGSLTKDGTGTLTLSALNTYSGSTTVNAGTLTATGTAGLGATTSPLTVNNNNTGAGTNVVLNLSTTASTTTGSLNGSLATPSSGTNTATINFNGSQTFTVNQTTAGSYAGVLAGNGNFKLGSLSTNTLTLTGTNTYSGSTTISGGILSTSNLQNSGTASNIGTGSSIVLDGGTLKYTGATQSINRAITLTNNGGTIDASGTGPITFANTGAVAMTGTNARTLTFTGTAGTTAAPNVFAGDIVDSTGATSVTKTGTGTWYLSGTNTYTGATTVNAGTLLVNGSTVSSTLNVNSLGTLAGTGTIGGQVNVNSGAFIAPGDGTTPLTVNNSVTINGGTFNLTIDSNALTNNRVVSNSLTLSNANLNINFSGTLTGTEEFVIARNVTPGTTAVTGTFNGMANGSQIGIYDGKAMYIYYDSRLSGIDIISESGTIILTPVPEPVSVAGITALALGFAGVIRRRRRALATKNTELAA